MKKPIEKLKRQLQKFLLGVDETANEALPLEAKNFLLLSTFGITMIMLSIFLIAFMFCLILLSSICGILILFVSPPVTPLWVVIFANFLLSIYFGFFACFQYWADVVCWWRGILLDFAKGLYS